MLFTHIINLFHVDLLSIVMMFLVIFIGIIVSFFSQSYMKGDSLYTAFFWNISKLISSVMLITITDNLLLFILAWVYCNWILTKLMIHKSSWKAAQASGHLALKNFMTGSVFITSAFIFFYLSTKSISIQYIVHNFNDSWQTFAALILLLIGAMMQSAIWPFHRWLLSSLNSPTPVSAIMHAGVINAGGFLLIRFAPLYLHFPSLLNIIFIAGLVSCCIGALFKLIQHDIKRKLACSTMEQMGFMLVQCGLGLFAPALAHLFFHGMFKAYLFLGYNGSTQEKKIDLNNRIDSVSFIISLVCATLSSYIFAKINAINIFCFNTQLFILGIVFVASCQTALILLKKKSLLKIVFVIVTTTTIAAIYGTIVHLYDFILKPLDLIQPQPLNILYITGFIALVFAWLAILYIKQQTISSQLPNWLLNFYVKIVNSSQPDAATITSYRKGYDNV